MSLVGREAELAGVLRLLGSSSNSGTIDVAGASTLSNGVAWASSGAIFIRQERTELVPDRRVRGSKIPDMNVAG